MRILVLLFPLFLYLNVSGQSAISSCNLDKCYQEVNKSYNTLAHLIKELNTTSYNAVVPKIYNIQHLKKDVEDVKKLGNKIKKSQEVLVNTTELLNQPKKQISINQKTVQRLSQSLRNISLYNTTIDKIINDAKNKQTEIHKIQNFTESVVNKCQKATSDFTNLKNNVTKISTEVEELATNFTKLLDAIKQANDKINITNRETINIKNRLERLNVPQFFFENVDNYPLNKSFKILKENIDLLKKLLSDPNSYKINDSLEEVLNQILLNLRDYEKAFTNYNFKSIVDETSRNLLNEIKKKIDESEKILKSIDFSEEEKRLLNIADDKNNLHKVMEETKKLKEANQELEKFLEIEKELENINKQVLDLRDRVNLLETWKKLKKEMEQLEKYRDSFLKMKCPEETIPGILT